MSATHGEGVYGNAAGVTTPLDHKMAQVTEFVKTAANTVRAGVLWDGSTTLVSGKANMSYDVRALSVILTRGATAGVVKLTNDAVYNVTTTAAPGSNSRYDVVYIWQREYSLDGTDSNPVIGVVQGTAAASPTVPSLAAFPGALELARILVPSGVTATNSGTTITQTAPFTASAGGVVVCRNATERDAGSWQAGQLVQLLDTDVIYKRTASAWSELVPDAGSILVAYQAISGNTLTIDSAASGGNLFTATYPAYEVEVNLDTTSAATGISVLMRASSADYTTGNHTTRKFELNGATPAYANSTTDTKLIAGRANGTGGGFSKFTIAAPQLAQYTKLEGQSHDAAISQLFWNHIPNTNVFTGMKIALDGVVTGTGSVTVRGLRKI